MKKLFVFALVAASLAACKKNSNEETAPVAGSNEIQIGSSQMSLTKAIINPGDANNTFDITSQIGVFNVDRAAYELGTWTYAKTVSTPIDQANFGYSYTGESGTAGVSKVWAALDGDKKLEWAYTTYPTNEQATVLVAYHPFNSAAVVSADGVLDFEFTIDQTKESDLRHADLMWASTTGKNVDVYEQLYPESTAPAGKAKWSAIVGIGIKKGTDIGGPINLAFNHMLSKAMFNVGFYHSFSGTEGFKEVAIKKISVEGPKITNKGKLDLIKGDYTVTPNTGLDVGYTFWDMTATPVAFTKAIDENKGNAQFQEVCHLVISPATFAATASNNVVKVDVTYQYTADNTVTPAENIVWETVNKTYTYQLLTAQNFETNKAYKYSVNMNLASKEIFITTTIRPWEAGADQDIEAQ